MFFIKYYFFSIIEWVKVKWRLAFLRFNNNQEFKILGGDIITKAKPGQVIISTSGAKFIKLSNGNFKLYKK